MHSQVRVSPRRCLVAAWAQIVRVEQSLVTADVHGSMRVHQQPREARREVANEALRQLAQSLLHVWRQLVVVMFLQPGHRGGVRVRPECEQRQ